MICTDQNYVLEIFYHYRPATEREYRQSLGTGFAPRTELLFCEAILREKDLPIASAIKSNTKAALEKMMLFLQAEGNDKAANWLKKLDKES
jgi:hypothetical protein